MTNTDTYLVLAVDDSPEALSFVHDALEAAGMDVLVALEGKQALTIAQRMKPDIILMDATMPGMDGFETCRALKLNPALADIPVIFMTGLSESEHVVHGLEVGGVDYLTKPIRPDELIARIRVHMNNVNLTRSAQSALDKTGQTLVTVNTDGQLQWATPLAHTMLAKAGLNDFKLLRQYQQQLRFWFKHKPQEGHTINLTPEGISLIVKVVGQQQGEWTLRLIDPNGPQDEKLLRDALQLTEREADVLFWLSKGKTNREIAEILQMSPRTVNKHLEQIFTKLEVDNRTSAAAQALAVLAKHY